jgi:ubiquinone biosynthesis protein
VQVSTLARLPQTLRSLQRLREILAVVTRYGWGDVVARLGPAGAIERVRARLRFRRELREGREPLDLSACTTEQRIRMALEELGPTFVKLGQVLATRPDLIPMSLVEELRRLQDKVPPFPAAEARAAIARELGRPVEAIFARFDDRPLAAASIGQVHRATLRDGGGDVVVKVRRPNLEAVLQQDLEILVGLAGLLEENVPETRQFAPRAMAEEFRRAVQQEVDLSREARNIERFAANFRSDPTVKVLRVHKALSSRGVLTLELIDGMKANDVAAIEAAGLDRADLARRGVEFVVRQVFRDGFFHADPHPGNIFVLRDGRIAPIDMGQMGSLDPEMRDALLELIVGVLLGDAQKIVALFQRLGLVDERTDLAGLRRDAQEMLDAYRSLAIAEVDVAAFIGELFDVLTRHHVEVPPELLLMGKALATIEGVARELDPTLDPMAAMRPLVLRYYLERLADPRFLARDVVRAAEDLGALAAAAPRELRTVLAALRAGRLTFGVEIRGLAEAELERARSANRIALAVVVGALLLGSSWLLVADGGPVVAGIPAAWVLGVVGLLLAWGAWLFVAWGFLRSGRF